MAAPECSPDDDAPKSARSRRRSATTHRIAFLFRVLAILIPLTVVVSALRASAEELANAIGVPTPASIGSGLRIALVALALVPALGTSLSLEALRRAANAIDGGRGLTLAVARALQAAASWMLGSSLAALVVPSLVGILLSLPTGRITLTVHVGSGVVMPVVLAGALRLVSGVVVEAAALADEHARIV